MTREAWLLEISRCCNLLNAHQLHNARLYKTEDISHCSPSLQWHCQVIMTASGKTGSGQRGALPAEPRCPRSPSSALAPTTTTPLSPLCMLWLEMCTATSRTLACLCSGISPCENQRLRMITSREWAGQAMTNPLPQLKAAQ